MPANLQLYGIRHHGPGSAKSLLQALQLDPPDLILIEGPTDAAALLSVAADPDFVPPVAMLVYNPKNFSQAGFFPFAEFSPEWQAIQFALQQKIPLRFMDLPMSFNFALNDQMPEAPELFEENKLSEALEMPDPFSAIAAMAGYSDPERWWEAAIEGPGAVHGADGSFGIVLELMQALRESKTIAESAETLRREAYMRQCVRTAEKEGFGKIAVVCGAWHTPAIAATPRIKASADAAVLKGLKKVKTEAVWIPWSFERLAKQKGYGAGVLAPAWYRVLFDCLLRKGDSAEASARWLSHAARLLREKDLEISSAHIIEATRLAEQLAALRHLALPGIEELREAAVSVLCGGSELQLQLIDEQLVIGDVLGNIPAHLPAPPLKADFEAAVRQCRLELKPGAQHIALDLRQDAHLRKSVLFHRILLLGIPWAQALEGGEGKQGSFHENWSLRWLPDYELNLIEAGKWGNTVYEAALTASLARGQEMTQLPALVGLLGQSLRADLPAVVPALLARLRDSAALATDVWTMAAAVLPLVETLRYGAARRMDVGSLQQILEELAPRTCLLLPAACLHLDEEQAMQLRQVIFAFNKALGLIDNAQYEQDWQQALYLLYEQPGSAPLLAGLALRLLFDKKQIPAGEIALQMGYRWSAGYSPLDAANWLDGFLSGSGILLLHYQMLWQVVYEWVAQLPAADFKESLPLLRRVFSRFGGPERQKLLELAKVGPEQLQVTSAQGNSAWDETRLSKVKSLLNQLIQ